MPPILVTGMSGAGKSTLLSELQRRGHLAVDTDYDGWKLPGSGWDELRMNALLSDHADILVSGTVENQGLFYDRFEHIVLLSAPLDGFCMFLRGHVCEATATREHDLSDQERSERAENCGCEGNCAYSETESDDLAARPGAERCQWRICFRWTDAGPEEVEIVDYH